MLNWLRVVVSLNQTLNSSAEETEDEIALMRATRTGAPDAFATLFRRHRPRIFALARRFFAPGSDRDDLIQEATIGFFKAIRDFRDERGSFRAFVELCVRRQIVTFVKTATRQKYALLNLALSLDAAAFADSDKTLLTRLAVRDTLQINLDSDNAEFLEMLWHKCSELERGVLTMYSKGYRFDEMSLELNVNYKSIDNAIWRIKVKARKVATSRPFSLSW